MPKIYKNRGRQSNQSHTANTAGEESVKNKQTKPIITLAWANNLFGLAGCGDSDVVGG